MGFFRRLKEAIKHIFVPGEIVKPIPKKAPRLVTPKSGYQPKSIPEGLPLKEGYPEHITIYVTYDDSWLKLYDQAKERGQIINVISEKGKKN